VNVQNKYHLLNKREVFQFWMCFFSVLSGKNVLCLSWFECLETKFVVRQLLDFIDDFKYGTELQAWWTALENLMFPHSKRQELYLNDWNREEFQRWPPSAKCMNVNLIVLHHCIKSRSIMAFKCSQWKSCHE